MRYISFACTFLLSFLCSVAPAQQAGPAYTNLSKVINFNGVLKDASGAPRVGMIGITASLYTSQEGGDPLWRESQTVQTDEQGRYTLLLGATEKDGLPLDLFGTGKAQWLAVQPEGQAEHPRVLLMAVPYALKAADAETIGGKPLSSFVLYEDLEKSANKRVPAATIIMQNEVPLAGSGTAKGAGSRSGSGTERVQFSGGIEPLAYNETGSNTWVGEGAGASITTNYENSFFGYNAGNQTTATLLGHESSNNSFFGGNAGKANISGFGNSFFGSYAGYFNTTAPYNSFFGTTAGYENTQGAYNCFFGSASGRANTTGMHNSFFGESAGFSNSMGGSNSFFGNSAGSSNTTGSYNSFFGKLAGLSNTIENDNSFIGAFSDGAAGITKSTAIGYGAKVTQSNSLVLGGINGVNGATADTYVGIGTTAPSRLLEVRKDQNGSTYLQVTNMNDAVDVSRSRFALVAGGVTQEMQSIARDGGYFGTTSNHPFRIYTNGNTRVTIDTNGNMGVGTMYPTARLHVAGNLRVTGSIQYGAPEEDMPDYVFEPGYSLMPVEQLGEYVAKEKHLPNVPSAAEVKKNGLNLGQFQSRLLEKIEELTLYTVQQATDKKEQGVVLDQQRAALAQQQSALEQKDGEIEMLKARLSVLEKAVEGLRR